MLLFSQVYSQKLKPVDQHADTVNVSIPFYSVQENDLSLPAGISYNTIRFKVTFG